MPWNAGGSPIINRSEITEIIVDFNNYIAKLEKRIEDLERELHPSPETETETESEASAEEPTTEETAAEPVDVTTQDEEPEVVISKAAQELADKEGVDVSCIAGSGKDGSVTKKDVQTVVDSIAA